MRKLDLHMLLSRLTVEKHAQYPETGRINSKTDSNFNFFPLAHHF